ncbi:YcaO-like family protein [Nonomuraea aurantiaca]|uniref:YcaO-like family protein n=1 Tax=Nonomuraea aurantiaca TaxID=2878562 RepID=UPI001CD9E1F2|nr:YcaO-like family protein [Nonomuraea aurantiaca]MCA2225174.1 YcaO-like family protein [Nonomuraea aurantiaca]
MYLLTYQGSSHLKGRSVGPLIELLKPYLDGRHTLAELTEELPPERRAAVESLLTVLLERDVVRDVPLQQDVVGDAGTGDQESALEYPEYRHEVGFIAHFRDSPVAIFRAYRDKVVLVLGSGDIVPWVARAALRTGSRLVKMATPEVQGVEWVERGRRTPDQRVERPLLADLSEEGLLPLLDSADLVLHVSGGSAHEPLLDRLCAERRIPLAQAVVLDGEVWLGPEDLGTRSEASWTAGRRRVATRPAPRPPIAVDETRAAAIAGVLVQLAFRTATGLLDDHRARLTRIDLSTLRRTSHAFVPHPHARPAEPMLPGSADPARDGAVLGREAFSRRAVVCADDLLGVFGEPTERAYAQIPLHVSEVEVPDPAGLLGGAVSRVVGTGLDFESARHQAALKAFAVYASLMVDPRRLLAADGRTPLAAPESDPDALLADLRAGRITGLVLGHRLADGGTRLIAADVAFPALPVPDSAAGTAVGIGAGITAGIAAGYSWQEAVDVALAEQAGRLALADLEHRTTPLPRFDLDSGSLPPRGERYRSMIQATGEAVTCYDLTGPSELPAAMSYLGDTPVGYAGGSSAAEAVTGALEQALLHYQARQNAQPAYAPPAPPGIPAGLRGSAIRRLPVASRTGSASLVSALARRGLSPVAVPLDHDREVHSIMPYTVHVVLTHA